MMVGLVVLTFLLFLLSSASAKLAIRSPKYSILSDSGSVVIADSLTLQENPDLTVATGPTETLKFSFTVIDDEDSDAGVQPHQAFLRFWNEDRLEGIQPVKVGSNGKAKFELNARRPPSGIPPTVKGTVLHVDLILGSFTRASSTVPLFNLKLPASMPVPPHPEESMYHTRPTIYHTFRGEPRTPPKSISLIFVVLALSPWILLVTLLSHLPVHFKPTVATAPFIAALAAFEGLIVWYWVDLRIGQVLSYGAILALFTAAAGKKALQSI